MGRPAAGVRIDLTRLDEENWSHINSVTTNADGRTDEPLLEGASLQAAQYRLEFYVGAYFLVAGAQLQDPPFLDIVPIRIGISDVNLHYHVPLLCTPWSYSTYRGS